MLPSWYRSMSFEDGPEDPDPFDIGEVDYTDPDLYEDDFDDDYDIDGYDYGYDYDDSYSYDEDYA